MIKLLCFDLDGTIIDTLYSIAVSMNDALKFYGYEESKTEEYINYIGNGIDEITLKAMKIKEKNDDFDKIKTLYEQNYQKNQIPLAKVWPNMPEVLEELKGRGYILTCISNKPDKNVKEMVEHFYPGLFSYIQGYSASIIAKPHQRHLEIMAEKFGLTNREVAYIGDSRVDEAFAHNYGCDLYLVTYGYEKKDVLFGFKPVKFIDSTKELLEVFK